MRFLLTAPVPPAQPISLFAAPAAAHAERKMLVSILGLNMQGEPVPPSNLVYSAPLGAHYLYVPAANEGIVCQMRFSFADAIACLHFDIHHWPGAAPVDTSALGPVVVTAGGVGGFSWLRSLLPSQEAAA